MDNWKQLLRGHCSIFEDMPALKKCLPYVSFLILLFVSTGTRGQTKILSGVILDVQSGERVPFASMRLDQSVVLANSVILQEDLPSVLSSGPAIHWKFLMWDFRPIPSR